MSILPGSTIGMLGGGQLGRMFTVAARSMGYDVIILDPDTNSPAGKLATRHICADFEDLASLDILADECEVITTEFENIPASTLQYLEDKGTVRPGSKAVSITQDRILEKQFLQNHHIDTADFRVIRSSDDLQHASEQITHPSILKVSRFGYDGKGQITVSNANECQQAWQSLQQEDCVLEQRMPLTKEVSVVLARAVDGEVAHYPIAENQHKHGILDTSIIPARIDEATRQQILETATTIANHLDYVGVMAVEFFITANQLLVNEIAPRPHNSGHYTLDACLTDQFEQQVRAVCALPLGETRLLSPVVMVNLLGDLWNNNQPPDWNKLLAHRHVKLNLYGKKDARKGRKMGHFNVVDNDLDNALKVASQIQSQLEQS